MIIIINIIITTNLMVSSLPQTEGPGGPHFDSIDQLDVGPVPLRMDATAPPTTSWKHMAWTPRFLIPRRRTTTMPTHPSTLVRIHDDYFRMGVVGSGRTHGPYGGFQNTGSCP